MPNPENLVRNEDRTPEQRKANASKGGIASGKARRKRRELREMLLQELYARIPGSTMNKAEYIIARVIKELADHPNMKDLRTAFELVGELEQKVTIDSADAERPVIVFKGREKPENEHKAEE